MQKRPTSVAIISWWLIISVFITLIVNIRTRSDPRVIEMMSKSTIPVAIQLAWLYAGALVSLASGIGMLKRQNWARYLYVIWTGIGLLTGFLTAPMKIILIPGLVVYAAITFFLFRPNANEYFTIRQR